MDRRIIEHLVVDGRMSFTDLAKALGMSTSAVHQRVRRLEDRGVITGYVARVDHAALGAELAAFVTLSPADPTDAATLPARLKGLPGVVECHAVAGDGATHLLKVRAHSPAALEQLLGEVRSIARATTTTTVVLSTAWE